MADQAATLTRASSTGFRAKSLARFRSHVVFYVLAGVLTLFFFGPFFWTLTSSLKAPEEITTYPPVFFPARLFQTMARSGS